MQHKSNYASRDAQSSTEMFTEGARRLMNEWGKGEEEKFKNRQKRTAE